MYILKGERNYIVDGQTLTAKENDCIIFKPQQPHSLQEGRDTFVIVDAKFLVCNKELEEKLLSLDTITCCDDENIIQQINLMLGYLHRDSLGKDIMYYKSINNHEQRCIKKGSIDSMVLDICFNTILLQILRLNLQKSRYSEYGEYHSDQQAQIEGKLGKIVDDYIRTHYKRSLTLSEIANHFGYNKNYLCQEFKRQTGKGVFQHLYDIRLDIAKKLLSMSDYTVECIAEITGFASANHMYRSFKKKYNITPGEYRKKLAKGVWIPIVIEDRGADTIEMYGGNLFQLDNN